MGFTIDQQKAIDLSGNSLLVSAAAGSGKTTVLSERVVNMLLNDNPVMLDRLMILTFTNAAADEMKTRISKRLLERLLENPEDATIRTQLSLLPSAHISTIDSACLAIVRENFEALGLDPRFSVGDESRLALQKTETLYEFVESLYENKDSDPDAKTVIDAYVRGKDDRELFGVLSSVSAFLEKQPYPDLFIKTANAMDFCDDALKIVDKELAEVIDNYNELIAEVHEIIADLLNGELGFIKAVHAHIKKGEWDEAYLKTKCVDFPDYPKMKKDCDFDGDLWQQHGKIRGKIKTKYLKIIENYLYAPKATIYDDRKTELVVLNSVFNLCLRLNDILLEKRKADRLASFNDIEKYTLSLVVESFDGVTLKKTELARAISSRFDEIIVDEYQDCNETQDLIFRALSNDEKNIFMVGDVKQSIYRFRRAQPNLFLKKQADFTEAVKGPLTAPSKINLSCNFRSHPKVLSFVNRVFYKLMTKEYAIDYSDGHELVPSTLFDNTSATGVDITLLATTDAQKATRATRIKIEAKHVAEKIKEIVGHEVIYDAKQKCERLVRASDVAVLLYAPKGCGSVFENALKNVGLECQNNNPNEKYLDTPEVKAAVAFLQAIDNPYDDIPLITIMYSEFFGFDENELGTIRANNKNLPFFDAVKNEAKTDKKCADFVSLLSGLRALSLTCTVYDLINAMYEKSGMLILAKDEKKRANLMLLSELAASFEADNYRGLFAFIDYLIKLSKDDTKLPSARLKGTDDCVNLLSIHRSKGLEYPVVFMCDCGGDIRSSPKTTLLYDSDFGIGGAVYDAKSHREFVGIMRSIIVNKLYHAHICECIRLLYVALTRATSRLYITGCMGAAEAEDMIISCAKGKDISKNPTFLKWVINSIIGTKSAHPLCAFAGILPVGNDECEAVVNIIGADEVLQNDDEATATEKSQSTFDKDKVKELITRVPDFNINIPAKLSVSEIKAAMSGKTQASGEFKKPRFLQGGVTGADRGSATHKFLQFCNFESVFDKASFEKEKERLVEYEFITKTEGALTDGDKIIEFLTSDTMKSLLQCGEFYKEKRFMFTLPANELGLEGNDQIIIQGVLDCYFITDDGAVIVDYKTDRVLNEADLIDRYRIQLDMYEKALLVTEGIKTHKKFIYSFALSKFILL